MVMDWGGGYTEQGPRGVYAVRKSGTGKNDGVKASGETTKIRSHWEGGYWATYGCTGKGGGGGPEPSVSGNSNTLTNKGQSLVTG